jgi:hypothetical protein
MSAAEGSFARKEEPFLLPDISPFIEASQGWWEKQKEIQDFGIDTRFHGPSSNSNMLIPGAFYVGSYPSQRNFMNLVNNGRVTKFICLVSEEERVEKNFFDYKSVIDSYQFVQIDDWKDMHDVNPNWLIELSISLESLIHDGNVIYIHCAGGHGRTGTLASVLLYLLYKKYLPDLTIEDILQYVQYSHDQRQGIITFFRGNQNYAAGLPPASIDNENPIPVTTQGENTSLFNIYGFVPGQNCFIIDQIPSPQTLPQMFCVKTAVKIYDDLVKGEELKAKQEAEANEHNLQQLNLAFGPYADEMRELLKRIDDTDIQNSVISPDPEKGGRRRKSRKTKKTKKIRKTRKYRK